MREFSNNELDLYVMGAFDGDEAALSAYLETNAEARSYIAEQAHLELLLREVAANATFCSACDDLVRADRCEHCGAAVRAGGYTVEEVLVQTDHGRLYLASDADGKRVALKELAFVQTPDAQTIASFERESKFLRALEHPSIPSFVASFSEGRGVNTRLYLAQEYIEGENLERRLDEHWFDEEEIIGIAGRVLDVLIYLQRLSPIVVHRDIKPANLIVKEDGSIAVVDFGAALDQGQTQGSTAIGTFGYMPIEQMAGIVDSTTDLYALGATLWHLLTRQEPWKILGTEGMDAANVSPWMATFLRKMTAAKPGDRFASAALAKETLGQRGTAALAKTQPKPKKAGKRWHRRGERRFFGWPLAFAAVAITGLGVGGHITTRAMRNNSAIEEAQRLENQAPAAVPSDDSELGELHIATNIPANLEVVGRDEMCVTPCVLSLPAGTQSLRLKSTDSGLTKRVKVTIRPGDVSMIRVRLEKTPSIELPQTRVSDYSFEGKLHEAVLDVAKLGKVSVVIPGDVDEEIAYFGAHEAPWESVFKAVLQSANAVHVRYQARSSVLGIESQAHRLQDPFGKTPQPQTGALPSGSIFKGTFLRMDIRELLTVLADMGPVKLSMHDGVRGTVSLHLEPVPWEDALRAVLANNGLGYRYTPKSRSLWVAPLDQLAK